MGIRAFRRGDASTGFLRITAVLLTSFASTAWAASGGTVAALELQAPTATEFVLHGTIPVPPDTFPRADQQSPFMVRNYDGSLAPAQVERVSWYADSARGADVVEVLARVRRDPALQPGTYITFEIVDAPNPTLRPALNAPVAALLARPWGLTLRTHDVFGNLYLADLRRGEWGRKILKLGSQMVQTRFYTALTPFAPVGGPTATLPHMMGVHSYVGCWAGEDVITVDLRIHNAASGNDKSPGVTIDDAQAKMYFDELELVVPAGWTILQDFADPFLGTPRHTPRGTSLDLVQANADGSYHIIGQQGQFERRIALTPIGNELRAREFLDCAYLGFASAGTNAQGQALWSWWNPATARYFPQRQRLPAMAHITKSTVRAKYGYDLASHSDALASGVSYNNYPIQSPVLGWAHPWGVKYGGMTSGTEIFLYDGFPIAYAASRSGYREMTLRHRMYTDRMPDALFDKDGEPTTWTNWIVHGPAFDYIPSNFYQRLSNGYDMFGFNTAPQHQVNYAAAQGLAPAYETDLLDHSPIDLQHLCRYLNAPKTLAWLGNDALAKDDILMQAEIARLSYHDLPVSAAGSVLGSGMLHHIEYVTQHPRIGITFGRGNGWSIDALCASYSLEDDAWRAQAKGWFDRVVWVVGEGQAACTGVIQSVQSTKTLNNLHRARQSVEQAIIENALWSMRESVYRDVDLPRMAEVEGILQRSLYSMIGFPGWAASADAPWSVVAVGPTNITLPLYCTSLPTGGHDIYTDSWQTWSSFAYGYQLTGDDLFLQRALEMAGNPADLTTAMHSGGMGANIENKAALIALSELVSYP